MKYPTIVFIACCLLTNVAHACQVCYAAGRGGGSIAFLLGDTRRRTAGVLTFATLHRAVQRQPVVTAASVIVLRQIVLHQRRQNFLSAAEEKNQDPSTTPDATPPEETGEQANKEDNATSALMIGTIGFYKKVISPLLPPACRFVPTCSQYGVQAIEKFGPTKGCVLIAWRLLRCSPIGGKGYDPPKWPPVPFQYSSY